MERYILHSFLAEDFNEKYVLTRRKKTFFCQMLSGEREVSRFQETRCTENK